MIVHIGCSTWLLMNGHYCQIKSQQIKLNIFVFNPKVKNDVTGHSITAKRQVETETGYVDLPPCLSHDRTCIRRTKRSIGSVACKYGINKLFR